MTRTLDERDSEMRVKEEERSARKGEQGREVRRLRGLLEANEAAALRREQNVEV